MIVTIMGFMVLTIFTLYPTLWFASMLWLQFAFGGFSVLGWKDWLSIAIITLVLAGLWTLWWYIVGSSVHISVGYS